VDWVPLAGSVPLQPPDAAHEVAFDEFQVNATDFPLATVVLLAVSVAVGTTLTVVLVVLLVPPGPAQVNEYVALVDKGLVVCVPRVARVPLQPPEAVHEVALDEVQVNVAVDCWMTELGDALSVAVGGTAEEVLSPPPQAANIKMATIVGRREALPTDTPRL